MDWRTLHEKSEEAAVQAHEALRAGDFELARGRFSQAAEAEEEALRAIQPDKQRTFGITAVGAVSLWFKAGDLARAARLAHEMLAGTAIPEFARAQLDDLMVSVYSEMEKRRADVEFLPGAVTVSVKGGEVVHGAAPLDLIVERVKTIQALYYRVIEWVQDVPHRKRGVPTRNVTDTFVPWLVQAPAGSFQFSVAIRKSPQLALFDAGMQPEAKELAGKFLDVVRTISRDADGTATQHLIPNPEYRQTFRRLVRNLAPSPKSFEALAIVDAEHDDEPITLGRDTRDRLGKALRAERPASALDDSGTRVQIHGILRALDLDRDWLHVDTDDGVQSINEVSQAVDDVIGPMVNRPVTIHAIKMASGKLRFVDIEPGD